MATNFPTSLDSFPSIIDNTTTIMASYINNIQDAVEALEVKVGVDSSAVAGSLDKKIRSFFDRYTPRKLYLYENTAPTRWSIVGSVSDRVLGLKGGSTYTTGGAVAGSWAITGWGNDSHAHRVWYYSANYVYSYNSGGSAYAMTAAVMRGEDQIGFINEVEFDNYSPYKPSSAWCELGAAASGTYMHTQADTHTHTHGGTWRPVGAVGIIAQYDG